MSLASQLSALASRIGLEIKAKINADHPGVAKAWVCFGHAGNSIVISSGHNVASVTRLAAGRYRVNFASPFPDANYCWTALARSSVDSGQQRIAIVRASSDRKTAQYVDIACATGSSSFADSTEINLVVFR